MGRHRLMRASISAASGTPTGKRRIARAAAPTAAAAAHGKEGRRCGLPVRARGDDRRSTLGHHRIASPRSPLAPALDQLRQNRASPGLATMPHNVRASKRLAKQTPALMDECLDTPGPRCAVFRKAYSGGLRIERTAQLDNLVHTRWAPFDQATLPAQLVLDMRWP
jgi:hypothetical protein